MALHVHEWGPPGAPAVLVVHGVRNTGARFRRLAADALPGRRVLAPDLRGHGRSTWDPPWDAAAHVADLIGCLDAAGVARADVVGHSFGGLLATHLAAAAPGRVGRLVLLDPAVALPPGVAAESAREDLSGVGRAASWANVDEARLAWLALRPPEGRWAADEDLAAHLAEGHDGRLRFRFSRAAAVCAWSEMARPAARLDAFAGQALLVTAARADMVTPALRSALRRDLGARFRETTIDAGHMLFWDAPERLAEVVAQALGRG